MLLVAASVVVRGIRMELGPLPDRAAIAWTRYGVIAFTGLAASTLVYVALARITPVVEDARVAGFFGPPRGHAAPLGCTSDL